MWVPFLRKRRQRSADADVDWPPVSLERGTAGATAALQFPTLSGLSELKAQRIARFKQQTLQSYTLTFAPRLIMWVYMVIGIIFIPIGASLLAGSADIRATEQQTYCQEGECLVKFNVTRTIPAPSYLYYVIDNMHQNLKIYVSSRSDKQLRGIAPRRIDDVWTCDPRLFRSPYENSTADEMRSRTFNVSQILNPCGLTAGSFFNDSFTLCRDAQCRTRVRTNESGIAWGSDAMHKFGAGRKPHYTDAVNKLLDNEHFVVWMRLSAFSRVEKLYARIMEPLEPDTYVMKTVSQFNARAFNGGKSFYISNTKWFGARNHFLGVVLLVVGIFGLVVGVAVLYLHVLHAEKAPHVDADTIRRELAKLSLENVRSN